MLTRACPALAGIDDGMRVYFHVDGVAKLLAHEGERQGLRQLAWIWVHEISMPCANTAIGVLETLRTPSVVIPCDAVAYEPIQVFTNSEYLQLATQLRGGGGTDMIAGIEAALQQKVPPDAVIVLTDGFTPFPKRPYTTPVIFAILKTRWCSSSPPTPPMPLWRSDDVILVDMADAD